MNKQWLNRRFGQPSGCGAIKCTGSRSDPHYGREPGAIVLRRDIYVGESSNEAQAVLQQALSRGYRNLSVAKRGRSCRLYPPLCILGSRRQ